MSDEKILWVKTTEDDPNELETIQQIIQKDFPETRVVVTTDTLELIDATEMRDALNEIIEHD